MQEFFLTKILNTLVIIADTGEKNSGIPDMLERSSVQFLLESLSAGDYLINNSVLIERKSRDDFVQSLINKRLFFQCSKLKQSAYNHLMIIEGDPYKTRHDVSVEAIRGVLVSISVAWQIPIIHTRDQQETFKILMMIANQLIKPEIPVFRQGFKPKRLKNRQLFFLQGIPTIGPSLALALLKHFGSLKNVINAPINELAKVPGIGQKKAASILNFIEKEIYG